MAQQDFYIKLALAYDEVLEDGQVADKAFEAMDEALGSAFPIFIELDDEDYNDEDGMPCCRVEDYMVELADFEAVGGWPIEELEREAARLKRRLEGFEFLAKAIGE